MLFFLEIENKGGIVLNTFGVEVRYKKISKLIVSEFLFLARFI